MVDAGLKQVNQSISQQAITAPKDDGFRDELYGQLINAMQVLAQSQQDLRRYVDGKTTRRQVRIVPNDDGSYDGELAPVVDD